MLKRKEHWATRAFHHFLMERSKVPFKWAFNDCALMAADGILAITGVDIAADFRDQYHDEASAFATIKRVTGGATVADAAAYCAAKHGLTELAHPLKAQRGDLVTVMDSGNEVAGLVHLSGRDIVVVGEKGLHRVSLLNVKRAWKVG